MATLVPAAARAADWSVLLVEDDDADALLVEELLADTSAQVSLRRARTIREALPAANEVQCVLLDLGLPDSHGLAAVRALLAAAPRTAVVVLTGLIDEYRGDEAVAAGAQDYLVKGQVDGRALLRAVRYAVERRRAEDAARALEASTLRAEENARLERGLLPRPLLRDARLTYAAQYRPGRRQALLGGDLYDVVETEDGRVHVLMGDVCGHGPDEAALGASLRIAWRTLVLAGVAADRRLTALQEVLVSERDSAELFATVCTLVVAPDRRSLRMRLAGHPPPALLPPGGGPPVALPDDLVVPALGVIDGEDVEAPFTEVPLPPAWSLLLVTDGLLEGHDGVGGPLLGWEGVLPEVAGLLRDGSPAELPEQLIDRVEGRNGGPLTDDVALLVLTFDPDGT